MNQAAILDSAIEANIATAFNSFLHEVAQITTGLDWVRATYLSDAEKLRNLSYEKANVLSQDIDACLRQLFLLSAQARILFAGLPEPRKEFFRAYDLLVKWNEIYRLETEHRGVELEIILPGPSEAKQKVLYGDPLLLEQLLYALISNAVKYCYGGTKIRLDCQREDKALTCAHLISVTNYGMKMEDEEDLYDLYKRGKDASIIGGLGIGLFIAKQIVTSHGGTIIHECEKLSDFNVPLIQLYLKGNFFKRNQNLISSLHQEIRRLSQSNEYNEIVTDRASLRPKFYDRAEDQLTDLVKKSTWRVTFKVTIPAKDSSK